MKHKIWKCKHCDEEFDYEVIACDKCHNPYFVMIEIEEHDI